VVPAVVEFSRKARLSFSHFLEGIRNTVVSRQSTVESKAVDLVHRTVLSCEKHCSQCYLPLWVKKIQKTGEDGAQSRTKHTVEEGCPFDPNLINAFRALSDDDRVTVLKNFNK
jgi:hypothetical protein